MKATEGGRRRAGGRALIAGILVAAAAGGAAAWRLRSGEPQFTMPQVSGDQADCGTHPEVIERVARGYVPGRSGDVLAIEARPHQFGTRHSTPYPYTQDVPLVLYGPGYIRQGTSDRTTTLADIAPTFAELLGFDDFPQVAGRPLREALAGDPALEPPRLIFTLVWDGGGDNVLRRWPDSWPVLKRLQRDGFSYTDATVGSSPSITPSTHATLGTGEFPDEHGLTDIKVRIGDKIVDAWPGTSPRLLERDTLADLWDLHNGNEPLVGLMARDAWHLGMIGHGAALDGGDRDVAVLDDLESLEFQTNETLYTMPSYVEGLEGLDEAIGDVDRRDGAADGRWLDNPMYLDGSIRETPAWSIFQTQRVVDILEREGFGRDAVPDLFFANYKSTDLAGHTWNMVDPEVRDALEEQDRQLGVLVEELDRLVGRGRYVLALTADHGMAPPPESRGGWSIDMAEITNDVERHFATDDDDAPLVLSNRGYQFMLDRREMERRDVTADDVARFVRSYTIGDNVTPDSEDTFNDTFSERAAEPLYATAFTARELPEVLRGRCPGR